MLATALSKPTKRVCCRCVCFDPFSVRTLSLNRDAQIETYISSEIDEDAIRLVQNRHPEVIHVGDITNLSDDDVRRYGPFDLVMGGSPCNDLSGANPRRRGLLGGLAIPWIHVFTTALGVGGRNHLQW